VRNASIFYAILFLSIIGINVNPPESLFSMAKYIGFDPICVKLI
jgi:hypothetical protein